MRNECDHGPEQAPSKYLDVYPKLAKERIVFISEDFTHELSTALTSMLLYYDHLDSNREITIFINSNGGEAAAFNSIYDVIKMIKAPVKTVCFGKAYSAGALLLSSGTKGMRFATKNSKVMIHGIQVVTPMTKGHHNTDSIYKYYDSVNNTLLKILSDNTGQPLDKVKIDCSKDYFLSAEEAYKYGIIDGILQTIS